MRNMFDDMNIKDLMSKAKDLQKNMMDKQGEAAKIITETTVGGGMVKLKMNGKMEVISLEIDPEIIDPNDKETLEDLIRAACNEGIRKSKDSMNSEVTKLMGNMKFPTEDNKEE